MVALNTKCPYIDDAMNNRLIEIIKYKTGGRQKEFAEMLGWTPQYLAKLLKGENFGITPVVRIVSTLPEINARWLLVGDGDMLDAPKYTDIRRVMLDNMLTVLDMEKYMPVMTPDELWVYEQTVTGNRKPDFSPVQVAKWQGLLNERNDKLSAKFNAAKTESDRICRRMKVK